MKTCCMVLFALGIAQGAWSIGPGELDHRMHTLGVRFQQLQAKADKSIPADLLRRARGIVLLERTKAGFLFAYQGGGGVAMQRDPKTDAWGPVAFLGANEASLGFQIGGEQSFFVILFMTADATRLLTEPNFVFGGEARGTAANSSAGTEGVVTSAEGAVLVFDDRKGLYAGAAIKGGAIVPDDEANRIYYGQFLSMREILVERKVEPTPAAKALAKKITEGSKLAGR